MARLIRPRGRSQILRVAAGLAALIGISVHLTAASAQAQVPTRLAYSVNIGNSIGIFSVSPTDGALNQLGTVATAAGPSAIAVDHSARFVYVANAEADRVSAFRVAGSGLTSLGAVAANDPVALALEPTGRFLYAADSGFGEIAKFEIRANGTLLSRGVEDAGARAVALAVHPSGRFLYSVDAANGRVIAYAIDAATGDLQLLTSLPSGSTGPIGVTVEPRGRYLYVLHDRQDLVSVFRINPGTGGLTPIQSLAVKNPAAIAVERTARFLFIASPENDAVFAYGISQTNGTLTFVDTEVLAQPAPVAVTVDPTNRVLYAASIDGGRITRLSIDPATGVMTEGPSVPTGDRPRALAVAHPTERFLYARGTVPNGNDALQAFRMSDVDGALTLVDDLTLTDTSTEFAVDPSGRFAYVLNHDDATIDVFRIDLASGELTNIQTRTLPAGVLQISGLTVEPTGRFLYVACASTITDNRIRAFRINPTTGLLTDLGGTGGDGNLPASATASDLSGRFVYTSRFNSDAIEIFAVDQATGMLTPLGISQSTGGTIAGFAMDPLGRFLFGTTFTGYVNAFRVSAATGALTAAGTLLMESGVRGPAIDPTGRFLYPVTRRDVTPGSGGNVHIFAIDQVSGALELSGVPPVNLGDFNTGQSTVMDVTGRFLYVGHGSDTVATFRRDPAIGAVVLTGEVVTPFTPTSLDTNGPIR